MAWPAKRSGFSSPWTINSTGSPSQVTCEAFNLKPEEVMMCAAHSGDSSAAQALGLRTGHIGRPGEGGPGTGEAEPKGSFDIVGKSFHDFADKLGV
jgi:2-haloacid dehalogenase